MINYNIDSKEKVYSILMAIAGLILYANVAIFLPHKASAWQSAFNIAFWVSIFAAATNMILLGNLRNNAVRISEYQFSELYEILKRHCAQLGLTKIPVMYVMQSGGVLNAFAARLCGKNCIVLYSDVVDAAYQQGMPAVEFIIGHELGHIVRGHVNRLWNLIIFPARFVPFLGKAYSRACEYTCDAIGYALCPDGAQPGLLILAAGKRLYKKVNIADLISNFEKDAGFTSGFSEMISTHPALVKRIARLHESRRNINPATQTEMAMFADEQENENSL